MKVLKKSLSLMLCALLMATPLAACGGETANNDDNSSNNDVLQGSTAGSSDLNDVAGNEIKRPTYYSVPDEFRWVAYSTPPNANVGSEGTPYEGNADYNTEEHWQTMADCGFEYAQPIHYDITDEDKMKSLANAEKVGIKLMFPSTDNQDSDSLGYLSNQGGTYQEAYNKILANANTIKTRYEKFMQYDSFVGIFGCDEPDATKFEAIAAAQDWFEDTFPTYEFYVNLLPDYASDEQLFGSLAGKEGYQTYDDYVARFCEIVNPYVVSYDHYCMMEDGSYLEGFFYNLAVGAINAKKLEDKYGWEVPFYIYLQSMGFEFKSQMNYYEQWAWQVYTSLAFGVQGIQAFNYWPHMAVKGNGNAAITDALVDRQGNKMPMYDFMKKTVDDITAIEELYLSYNWEHACGWGGSSGLMQKLEGWEGFVDANTGNRVKGYTDISDIVTNQEILIGQFKSDSDSSKKAYVVTNASDVNGAATMGLLDIPELAAAYNAEVTLTFASGVSAIKVYKPGGGGIPQTITLSGGKATLNIPTGEGFFIEVVK